VQIRASGTTAHGSYLGWVGVETHVRIRMQDVRARYHRSKVWAKTLPARTAALAATPEHGAPQDCRAVAEEAQRHRVTGYSMIAVVAFHNTFQPLPDDV